jgi:hypothetical protein
MFFPITCVDNFYSEPDKIIDFALSLEYGKDELSIFPGQRTKMLHEIDSYFFNLFCKKIFSLFFNVDYDELKWRVQTGFQKTYKYECSEKNINEVNSGWIHIDDEMILAGVIYLNKFPNIDSGTSFYNSYSEDFIVESLKIRDDFYRNKSVSIDEYVELKTKHNSNFCKTAEFKNVYNRLVAYDSQYWHKESSFLMDSEDFRLTQVFFVSEIEYSNKTAPPISRSKKIDI